MHPNDTAAFRYLFEVELDTNHGARVIHAALNYIWKHPSGSLRAFLLQSEPLGEQTLRAVIARGEQLLVFRDALLARDLDPTRLVLSVEDVTVTQRGVTEKPGHFARVFLVPTSVGLWFNSVLNPLLAASAFPDLTPRQLNATVGRDNINYLHHPGCGVWSDKPCTCSKALGALCTRCGSAQWAPVGFSDTEVVGPALSRKLTPSFRLCWSCAEAAFALLEANGFARYNEVKRTDPTDPEAPDAR